MMADQSFVSHLLQETWDTVCQAAESRHLPDLDLPMEASFPLFDAEPWGQVSLSFRQCRISNLTYRPKRGVTFDSDAISVSVQFGRVALNGKWNATASPRRANAIETAWMLLQHPDAADSDPNLQLAQNYRDQLVTSAGGLLMVGTYYDDNDTMDTVIQNSPTFQQSWSNFTYTSKTTGKTYTTTDLANMTATGAQNPDTAGVGGADYNAASNILRGYFLTAVLNSQGYSNSDPAYVKLASDVATFSGATSASGLMGPQPVSVNQVMSYVTSSTPPTGPLAAPEMPEIDAIVAQGWAKAEREVEQKKAHEFTRTGTSEASWHGEIDDALDPPPVLFSGKVVVTGSLPRVALHVRFTSAEVKVPRVDFTLSGEPGALLDRIRTELAKSKYIGDLAAQRIADRISSPQVLKTVSDLFNAALRQRK
jgi:hypothetical protein